MDFDTSALPPKPKELKFDANGNVVDSVDRQSTPSNQEIIYLDDCAKYLNKHGQIHFVEALYLVRHIQEILKIPFKDEDVDILPLPLDKFDRNDPYRLQEKNRRRTLMIEHLEEREKKILEQKELSLQREIDINK